MAKSDPLFPLALLCIDGKTSTFDDNKSSSSEDTLTSSTMEFLSYIDCLSAGSL